MMTMKKPESKCIVCHKMVSVELFGDNNKGSCFKSCDVCRAKRRTYERNNTMSYIMSADAAVQEIYIDTFSNQDDVDATKKVASPFAKISSPPGHFRFPFVDFYPKISAPPGLSRFSDVRHFFASSSAAATSTQNYLSSLVSADTEEEEGTSQWENKFIIIT